MSKKGKYPRSQVRVTQPDGTIRVYPSTGSFQYQTKKEKEEWKPKKKPLELPYLDRLDWEMLTYLQLWEKL